MPDPNQNDFLEVPTRTREPVMPKHAKSLQIPGYLPFVGSHWGSAPGHYA